MSLPSSLLTCRPARAVVVSAVVCEAARAEVAGGTVRDRQQERDEAVQRDTAGRHQPLPGRAGQVQQGTGDLRVLTGQQQGLGQSNNQVGEAKPLEDPGQPQGPQVTRLSGLGVDDQAEEYQDGGPLENPQHESPPRHGVTELALGGDGQTDTHDPDEPGEHQVRHCQSIPGRVIEEIVASSPVVDEDHDGDGQTSEGVQTSHSPRLFSRNLRGLHQLHGVLLLPEVRSQLVARPELDPDQEPAGDGSPVE